MFTLPVGELLASYTGDSREFTFDGEVFDGYYDDIRFLEPLHFKIRILALEDGINVYWDYLKTRVEYDKKKHTVNIRDFDRTWKVHLDPMDADDIREIG